MTVAQGNEQASLESEFLTEQEQAVCVQIACREAPHSQRALALLALNERSTQAEAAEQAGLRPTQVKYWVAKFRKQRLGIFPATLLDEFDTEAEEVELVIEIEEELESVREEADSAEETKGTKAIKGKKARKKTGKAEEEKKGKKAKGTGKAKKGKKGKKAKASKKKTKKAKKD